jgi:hypothetical protein
MRETSPGGLLREQVANRSGRRGHTLLNVFKHPFEVQAHSLSISALRDAVLRATGSSTLIA